MSRSESLHAPDLGVPRILERQMRNWELSRAQRLQRPGPASRAVEPFVCVSRQVGSGGTDIARTLASRLNWPAFDRELLQLMAADDDVRRRIYESMDERDVGWCEETLRCFIQPEFGRNDYVHKLSRVVLGLARQGSAVFLGRGIDLLLPRELGVRVRLVAATEVRVHTYAQRMKLTLEKARAEVRRIEQEREEFIRRAFRSDASDPARFDLTINTATFTADQAVELILKAVEYRSPVGR